MRSTTAPPLLELRDVRAGRECFAARARDDDRAHGVVGGDCVERVAEIADHLGVDRVSDFGAIERDGDDGPVLGDLGPVEDGLVAHDRCLAERKPTCKRPVACRCS